MKFNRITYMFLAGAMAAVSCTKETDQSDGQGYLTAVIAPDAQVTVVSTKADLVTTDDPFTLRIYRGTELVSTVADHHSLMTNPLKLNCATYRVTAENKAEEAAAFDSPRYAGEANVKVLSNTTVNADITCSVANALVFPSFSDDFGDYFTSWSLTVSNGSGSLEWSNTNGNIGKTGYFSVTNLLEWTLTLTNKAGRRFTRTDEYNDVQAAELYNMHFSVEQTDTDAGAAGPVKIILDDNMTEREFDLVLDFTSSEAEAKSANAWAVFADITGEFKNNEVPDGLKLEYKTADSEVWTEFTGDITTDAENKKFTARLTGLTPGTDYVVRAKTTKEMGKKQISFTTEEEAELHNMNLDQWYQSGKAWMPNASSDYSVWDSANPGSASFGVNPTTPESDHVAVTGDGKQAAKLKSQYVVIKFAAGNLFTGGFVGLVGTTGAKLNWGTPFYTRPLAMKGYLDYAPVAIDRADSDHSYLKGQTDTCQIQVFLTDRTDQYFINTAENQFVDFEGSDIIAYGKFESGVTTSTKSDLVNGYEPFTIKLEYRDYTRKPNQIVIVAAASKYGDFFTGGDGSVLYLDEFSFVYDPANL